MYLLDSNVVSELRRPRPHPAVLLWLQSVPFDRLYVSAVTIGELQAGVEITRTQDKEKAAEIEAWLNDVEATHSVLPMDASAFRIWAKLMHGQSDDLIEDAMIAATAAVQGLTVVSRNVRDFARLGVEAIDPFASRS